MTKQEIKDRFNQASKELEATVIPKVTNATMDAFEKRFDVGIEIGCKVLCDMACEWLKQNMYVERIFEYNEDEEPVQYVCASACDSVEEFVNKFRKAM